MKYSIIRSKILNSAVVALFWIIVWQIIYMLINNENLVVSPLSVLICFFNLVISHDFWKVICLSIIRIFSGFIFSIVVGITLAILMAKFKIANLLLKPIISIIKATPVVSLIVLVTAFMNINFIPTFISFLMVLPIMWSNIYQGIITADEHLLEMAKVFKIKKVNIIKKIYIPNIIPYFISSVTTGIGFAWKSGISAEVLVKAIESVGNKVSYAKTHIQITELFTWTAVIIILCVILEKITILIMKKLFTIKNNVGR